MTTNDTDNTTKTTDYDSANFHRIDRVMGVLTGQAAGDALGAGYEFSGLPPRRGQARMLPGTLQRGKPGEWTDDTSMAIAIAQARSDPAKTAANFLRWFDSGPKDIGNCTRAVLGHCNGTAASLPGISRAYGEWMASKPVPANFDPGMANGSLMRTGPVALPFLGDRDKIAEAARVISDLTHYDPSGITGDACVLWSLAISDAIAAGPLFRPAAIAKGLELIPQERRVFWAKVIKTALSGPAPRGFNGSCVGAFKAALYAVSHGRSLPDTLQLAVSLGHDTDTVAAIAGSLAGAWRGDLEVPKAWKKLLHGYPDLRTPDLQKLALKAAS